MKLNRKQRRALKAKGVKMTRSEEEIKKEYVDLCTRAGELQYQLEQMKAGLHDINGRILSVNKEFVELKQSQEQPKGDSNVEAQAQTD
ncbi:MAG: hypothetical protein EB120_04520 [Proteobacteria bacterium]|nr:hypothetical protein [Pseudomonadota bacterium]